MKNTILIGSLLLLAATGTWTTTDARETPVRREALPAAVSAALESHYHGAEILGLTQEITKRDILFEAEMKVAGLSVDALFESNGTLREEEAEIGSGELPDAVRSAYAHSAQAKWTIARAERIRSGAATAPTRYELLVTRGEVHLELVYAANGSRLSAKKVAGKD